MLSAIPEFIHPDLSEKAFALRFVSNLATLHLKRERKNLNLLYESKTEEQFSRYKSLPSPRPKKMRQFRPNNKRCRGGFVLQFVPPVQTATSIIRECLQRLRDQGRWKLKTMAKSQLVVLLRKFVSKHRLVNTGIFGHYIYYWAGRGFDSRWCHWNFSVT